ncbi:hypothetical protein [Thalassoglobus polymorphus]|uniref:CopG-like ribbon-helix-helix domain-containing protein n=1 Tax=Thalassoglobus polymorphus TaxID=2527994 RepID=A0A517QH51_9PLAN|nr:hypothetical protein [Thalassoglobus polymorphus]QDT30914.1 hypothetical protein Mal48_01430 [Thalassoglobus polymorphus]QDT30959.1 hypothetical protein Mal48_01880 [Thalassoglobus polymorphus]
MSKKKSKIHRQPISGPVDWWDAFKAAAKKDGRPLSEWVTDLCKDALPASERKKLSERTPQGRPRVEKGKEQ